MKKNFWALIILTVVSCSKEDKLPEGYMDQVDMVAFLIDLHIAQASIQNLKLQPDSATYLFNVFERQILEEHNSKDSVFYKSYSWYLERPEIMLDIYTAVVDTLSLRESIARRTE